MGLKEFIWKIFYKDKSVYINQLIQKNLDLTRDLVNCSAKLIDMSGQLVKTQKDLLIIKELHDSLFEKLTEEEKQPDAPEWLELGEIPFQPRVRIVTRTGEKIVNIEPVDMYTRSAIIRDTVLHMGWKEKYLEDKKDCARSIWNYVIKAITYEFDKFEDWRFSPVTLSYKKGDCEDGTILFLDLAREAGFKANEVFNAVGWFKQGDEKFGHSYPILNYGEGWFIYETTIDFLPDEPMKFEGSGYTADWGLSNWEYQGVIKDNKLQV